MSPNIRPLCREEVGAIAQLARTVWAQAYRDIITPAQIDYMLAQRYCAPRLLEELARPDIWWDQAFVGPRRLGFASTQATAVPGEFKLDKLYVHPEAQRQGVGSALLAHVQQRARARGGKTLILAVNKNNAPAIAAYRKNGFEVRESVCVDIGHGFVMDDFIMAKSLV
ncbi:MAG TPA: GNAT family N-acetyltransferase [Azospira sp.]|nr:GNAT family N-acetyltransferase [Azospira sp.]